MVNATGIANFDLTPGVWVQGPNQAATSLCIVPVGGLQISVNGGATWVTQSSDQPANALQIKGNLNEFWFRCFGAPITITITWAS